MRWVPTLLLLLVWILVACGQEQSSPSASSALPPILVSGAGDELRYVTPSYLFALVDDTGEATPSATVVPPAPRLDAALFPGGEIEGWIVSLAPVGQPVWLEFHDPNTDEAARTLSLP